MATGQQLIEKALLHQGEKYILGARAQFNNPNYKGPWDCAEFVSWIIFQTTKKRIGMRDGDAYTGYWAADADDANLCQQISLNEAYKTPGAILLRKPERGIIGHIVFSIGDGKTIEAMNRANGVKKGVVSGRRWTHAILIKGVNYTANTAPVNYSKPTTLFVLKSPVMKHETVLKAKHKLVELGYVVGEINNEYDKNMEIAVYNYQLNKGLVADGDMGEKTLKSLGLL